MLAADMMPEAEHIRELERTGVSPVDSYVAVDKGYQTGTMVYAVMCFQKANK
jgi:hypothetical protein